MQEKELSLEYHGSFGYYGEYRGYELAILGFYLEGKPDTPEWRDEFAKNEIVPVEHKGKIFEEWAVLDACQLYQEDPEAVMEVLEQRKLSPEDIPSFRKE